jgi:hypothetical protein
MEQVAGLMCHIPSRPVLRTVAEAELL